MSIQNQRLLSLAQLSEWYKAMLEAVKSLDGEIGDKVKESLKKGQFYLQELLDAPNKLKSEIDRYFQIAKPFEWNRGNRGKLLTANIEKDWEQHEYLITFAMLLGDESFLKKWGVEYPLSHDGPGLANPSYEYIEILESAKNQCSNVTHKHYYEFLIRELASRIT